ncbi:hypothetical protein TW95_gp1407 [Pandoravirus inopinatum]|uniref:Uncharacterized protein n=1 Tax=Pandoravirus inopinatum TaxID=1605721 RepID=A0A0B5JAW7_9VIRU|nr:hypothetical protein TW95_gp1407 [Pandoravirus inopinatum]AJF98141.1 hypothetical protein [Pandoravirus inopinatum]
MHTYALHGNNTVVPAADKDDSHVPRDTEPLCVESGQRDPGACVQADDKRLASVLRSKARDGHVFIVPRDVDSHSVEVWRLSLDRKRPSLSRPSAGIKCERASFCVDRASSFVVRGRTSDGLDFRVVVAVDDSGSVIGWLCRSPRRVPCIYPRACLVCVRA